MDNILYEFATAQATLPIFVCYRSPNTWVHLEQYCQAIGENPDDIWQPASDENKTLVPMSGVPTRFIRDALVAQINRSKYPSLIPPPIIAALSNTMRRIAANGRLADGMIELLDTRSALMPSMTVFEYLENLYDGGWKGELPETLTGFEHRFQDFCIYFCSDHGIPVGEVDGQEYWKLFSPRVLEVCGMLFPDYELSDEEQE